MDTFHRNMYRQWICRATFSVLGIGATVLLPALAQEANVIVTDRPDFVNSAAVVGTSRFQLETGIAIERNRDDGRKARTVATPVLLRYGLNDTWELRLESDGRVLKRVRETRNDIDVGFEGYGDLAVGTKWHLTDNHGWRPATAILASVEVDTGSKPFRGQDLRPSVQLPAEWALGEEWGLGVMPGLTYDKTDSGDRFYSGMFGVVLGKSWTDRLRTFIEVAAPQIARRRYGGTVATFDLGAAYLLNDRWQVDMALFKGLNDNTADVAATVGLSAKF